MRTALEQHLAAGRNAAFFTGNTAYFRIRYDPQRAAISRLGRWEEWPEEQTFGVSYRYGGGKWRGGRPAASFTVCKSNHWLYRGCELRNGDVFGADARLVGYECDGAPTEPDDHSTQLAQCDLSEWSVSDGSGEIGSDARATIVLREKGGRLLVAKAAIFALSQPVGCEVRELLICPSMESSWP